MIDAAEIDFNRYAIMYALRERKKELGITYKELSEKSGVSEKYVAEILSPYGITHGKSVRLSTLISLLIALKLTITIEGEEDDE